MKCSLGQAAGTAYGGLARSARGINFVQCMKKALFVYITVQDAGRSGDFGMIELSVKAVSRRNIEGLAVNAVLFRLTMVQAFRTYCCKSGNLFKSKRISLSTRCSAT